MEILQAIDTERIRTLRNRGEFFWLDIADPVASDLDPLRELVTIHPLAFEDTNEFGQRAKLDHYAQSALLVAYGAAPRTDRRPHLVEVHLHISGDALVTVSREPLTAERPTTAHRQQIFALRRELAEMRRVLIPQRDLLAPGGNLLDVIPHADEMRDSFRDVHDHLDRAAGQLGSYREQLAGLLDLYLTEVSTRLNEVMKRLTMIATVFLPLSFLVGFFGMNFGWFVDAIAPLWTFVVFGVGLLVASTIAVAVYLRRAGGG